MVQYEFWTKFPLGQCEFCHDFAAHRSFSILFVVWVRVNRGSNYISLQSNVA